MATFILAVDDVPKNLQLIGTILSNNQFETAFATSGQAALRLVERRKPDLILLDVMMPGMDGYEVCSILKNREETASIPIIFVTGRSETSDMIKGFEIGGSDYVTKPFQQAELLARIRTHIRLKEQRELLQELNQKKDHFFSLIAHDLRGPFQGLLGLSEILSKEVANMKPEEITELSDALHVSAQSVFRLLENLLEWSLFERGLVEARKREFLFNQIINDSISLFSSSMSQKNLDCVVALEPTKDVIVDADAKMLRSVVRNLFSNAVKFSYNSGSIRVETGIDSERKHVFCSIIDEGSGAGPAQLSALNRGGMVRIGSTEGTRNEKGSGLGIMLCRQQLDEHDGNIFFEPGPSGGLKATFSIPYVSES
ncbi:MAG: hybrid sensor histidine kinase/response regulator [Balneolales bacterium]|nr:hybrid sensor histidine kinase/response regulator [Balneolales bacterium]